MSSIAGDDRSDDEVGATLLNNLGLLCRERGASVEAVALFQRSVSASEQQSSGDRYRAALTEENLALAYGDLREFEEGRAAAAEYAGVEARTPAGGSSRHRVDAHQSRGHLARQG